VDAYINLAQLYLKRKDRGGVDWADQAQWNLDRALGISPKNERANYLYGRLHAELDLPDVAIASLQNTSFLPEAQELLAKIYAGQQNYGEAVRHMRQAILLDGDANHRYLQFADYVLRLTRDPDAKIPNRKPLLEEALSRVKKVRKGDYQQWAARLKERLEKSISQTGNKSPAEPPAEGTVPAPAPAPAPTPAAAPLDSPGL
jgi:lipopolysaccharide biosynthesis regulator YciM